MKLYNLVLCCQSCHQNTGSYLAITGTDKTKYKYCLSNEEMQLSETCSSNSHMTLLFQSVSVKTEDESIRFGFVASYSFFTGTFALL